MTTSSQRRLLPSLQQPKKMNKREKEQRPHEKTAHTIFQVPRGVIVARVGVTTFAECSFPSNLKQKGGAKGVDEKARKILRCSLVSFVVAQSDARETNGSEWNVTGWP